MKHFITTDNLENGDIGVYVRGVLAGKLQPVPGRPGYYTIRMGEYGGFYNETRTKKDALYYLLERHVEWYSRQILHHRKFVLGPKPLHFK